MSGFKKHVFMRECPQGKFNKLTRDQRMHWLEEIPGGQRSN